MSVGRMIGAGCVLAGLAAGQASAGTVGLWLFDDVVDLTPPAGDPVVDPPGGEIFYDETPNAFDFLATTNFGTFTPTVDRPAPISVGDALISAVGGSSVSSTPASSQFSRGNTGAITVEFWFKYTNPTPDVGYVLSFGGGSAATRNNEWGIYALNSTELRFFNYEDGNGPYPEVGTGALGTTAWHHIAFTVDAANSMKAYLDGTLVNSNTSASVFGGAVSDVLKWGRSHADGFGNHTFVIDELRISDVALLPGNGTGVGELAWNASLVPEPAGVGMAIIALGGLMTRRRLHS